MQYKSKTQVNYNYSHSKDFFYSFFLLTEITNILNK